MKKESVEKTWEESPYLIRKYLDNIRKYKLLCKEVEYILKNLLDKSLIKYSSVTSRSKSLESFCEKIYRKSYEDPLNNITDLAGVRVVFLYIKDKDDLKKIIEDEFIIIEVVDKNEEHGHEKFGYEALHYLVKLKSTHMGARYDELQNLICEIQVRTILQDAWAIVAHHLSYKQESDVPEQLRRKLNALSGLFETADDQFENLRNERNKYQKEIEQSLTKNNFLSLEENINLDNLTAFLLWRYGEIIADKEALDLGNIILLTHELRHFGYLTLLDLNKMLDNTEEAFHHYQECYPPTDEHTGLKTKFNAIGITRKSLAINHNDYYKSFGKRLDPEEDQKKANQFKKYLKKQD